jgi:hypothetical protein
MVCGRFFRKGLKKKEHLISGPNLPIAITDYCRICALDEFITLKKLPLYWKTNTNNEWTRQ